MNRRRFHHSVQCMDEEETTAHKTVIQVAAASYVTVDLAAFLTGLSEKAIRRKIEDGKWIEGREYRRSPDKGIFISMKDYDKWVEKGMV